MISFSPFRLPNMAQNQPKHKKKIKYPEEYSDRMWGLVFRGVDMSAESGRSKPPDGAVASGPRRRVGHCQTCEYTRLLNRASGRFGKPENTRQLAKHYCVSPPGRGKTPYCLPNSIVFFGWGGAAQNTRQFGKVYCVSGLGWKGSGSTIVAEALLSNPA